jgi:glycosyltransferase involved in cell wall biosynthesis
MPGLDVSGLKVAQIVRPAEGGIRRHVSLLIRETEQQGVLNTLFAPASFGLEFGIQASAREVAEISPTTRPLADAITIRRLTADLKASEVQLVHAHGLRAALIGSFAASFAGIPALFTAHNMPTTGSQKPSLIQRLAIKLVAGKSSGIICVSNAVAEAFRALGVSPNLLHVIPNGIDLALYSANHPAVTFDAIPSSATVIGFIGRLSSEKGVDLLLQAFNAANLPEAHLVIVGDGPEGSALKETSSRLACARRIHFVGHQANPIPYLKRFDLLCAPSRLEGQGISVLEAMACRVPVVASDAGGLKESLANSSRGYSFSVGNVEQLLTAMEAALLNTEATRERVDSAALFVQRNCGLDSQIERILRLYSGTLSRTMIGH